ncbi:MCT family MFS transporter [Aspergillus ibericus CBS 121593]|uniref:Putative monocarboxylate permease n=1 Tax=Aspergillus ibericus CBS 121593 TaxID=1448316 RepID=A0A395H847_9EURO|nr:putative monocarboxylate permease [Aspergillus ibericus CBS 121593]RAL03683.1 putative monocarboxylate permease [Aspergillus ibericus CBS 121593]
MAPPAKENDAQRLPEASNGQDPEKPYLAVADRSKPPQEAPDGGLTAWLVVLGSWCVLFCSFGWINSIGTFQEYYETDLLREYSASTIAWIPSLQIFFMYAMSAVVGLLYDHFGPHWLLLVGSFLHVFGLMMASISTEYYQILLSQGVCSAIGVSIIFQPAISVIPGWFHRKRGAAFGITTSGSSIGGVILPIMMEKLITRAGFGWAMRSGAFLILGLLIIGNLTIRSRQPPRPKSLSRDALLQPFHEPKMMLVIVGFVLLTFGVFIPMDYLVVESLSNGMHPSLAQYMLPILNAGSLFGRLSAGLFADRFGPYNIFILVCYLAGILILALWIPATSTAANIVFAILFGFSSGAYVALAAALVVKISPFPQIGYRIGLVFFFASFSGLTTNPIAGAILAQNHGSYTGMKVFAGVLLLAGTSLILVARIMQTGWTVLARF